MEKIRILYLESSRPAGSWLVGNASLGFFYYSENPRKTVKVDPVGLKESGLRLGSEMIKKHSIGNQKRLREAFYFQFRVNAYFA